MPQKLTTTACFIQEESSGGKQFRKHVSCFYPQGGNVGVLSEKDNCLLNKRSEIILACQHKNRNNKKLKQRKECILF